VRVAVGRNYLDATPTSGTIFVGGGGEILSVDVTVEPHGVPRPVLAEVPPPAPLPPADLSPPPLVVVAPLAK
jgi:hypothetical protein